MQVKPETARLSRIMEKTLLEYVLGALEKSRGRWPEIAKASGVPYHTLTKIAQRQIENPGIKHIQQLASYFQEHEARAA